jgi:polyhydroxybutyrate depolymerase
MQSAAGCLGSGRHVVDRALTYVPRGLAKRPPLLLMFHGMGDGWRETEAITGLDSVAARNRFVVAYPIGQNPAGWQLNHSAGDADVGYVRRLIAELAARACADPHRVYLTGFSNGAGFAWRVGCELAGKVAAVALVSGSYKSQDECPAGARPMPTLEIHGRDPWTSTVTRLIADTTSRNHCTRPPVRTRIAAGVTRTRWPGCNLERIYNQNLGHKWLSHGGPYNTSAEVWKFVSRFRR